MTGAVVLRGCEPAGPATTIQSGLCAGRDEIADGGIARDIYVARVHDPLHDLEARIADLDEAAAARLADANESLETALDGHADITMALDGLVDEVRRAAEVVGEPDPGPC